MVVVAVVVMGSLGVGVVLVIVMAIVVVVVASLELAREFVVTSPVSSIFGVVLQDPDEVELDHDHQEEVDPDEHPEEVIGGVAAVLPVNNCVVERLAEVGGCLIHIAREEDKPDVVDQDEDECGQVGVEKVLAHSHVVSLDEGRDEEQGQ